MDDNPFASPQTCDLLSPSASQTAELPSLARDGKLLVMHRRTELPPVCVKSGLPAEGKRIRVKLFLVSPVENLFEIVFLILLLWGIGRLVNGYPFVVLTLMLFLLGLWVRKVIVREFIDIPLSIKWRRRLRIGSVVSWGGIIVLLSGPYLFDAVGKAADQMGLNAFLCAAFVSLFLPGMCIFLVHTLPTSLPSNTSRATTSGWKVRASPILDYCRLGRSMRRSTE